MAGSSNSDVAAQVTEWERLGKLGMEAGIFEFGLSEEKAAQFLKWDRSVKFPAPELYDGVIYTEAERALLLALVGRSSSSVRYLDLRRWDLTKNEATALCVNLRSNMNIKELVLYLINVFGTKNGCTLLGSALAMNTAVQKVDLRSVGMKSEAVTCLLDLIHGNKTLLDLDLRGNDLGQEGMKSVAEFLKINNILKVLGVQYMPLEPGDFFSWALKVNTSLEELKIQSDNFHYGFNRGLLELFKTLSPEVNDVEGSSNSAKNTTLKTLELNNFHIASSAAEDMACMIRKNNTLTALRLSHVIIDQFVCIDKIFPALKENGTLQELDLFYFPYIEKNALQAILDLARCTSTRLRKINLTQPGTEHLQPVVDEELRLNREYRAKLRGQTTVQTVSGRLVLCGYGFAGKTAILQTMESIEQGTLFSHPFKTCWKKLFSHMDLTSRTRGFSVVAFKKQRYLAYVWDFAGQQEFYALHDYLFPDEKNSCFLYVCSCRTPPNAQNPKGVVKSQETMKSECEFWMKFIASNSKSLETQDSHGRQLPSVRFVLTKKDTLDPDQLAISKQCAQRVVRELRQDFKDVVNLCATVEVVNAHSLADVKHLLTLTNDTLEGILADQREYAICEEIRKIFARRSVKSPIMSTEDFYNIQEGRFNFALTPTVVKKAVLAYLNDVGELICPRGFDFIADPRWFGVRVFGMLINAFRGVEDLDEAKVWKCFNGSQHGSQSWTLVHDHGYVDVTDMRNLLNNSLQTTDLQQSISSDKLIQLMIRLELCFKKEPGNVDSPLFLPALFDDKTQTAARGERQLDWKLVQTGTLHYLGRRLECENKAVTFLTPGFFPRLQVHLWNYIHEKKWTENPGFTVDRNLICFADNGIEVLVEYSGDIDYFVDVLVRSAEPHSVALAFIEEHVIKNILHFCASPQGCQGVTLVEAVIRPECVRDLHLCVKRKDHSVLVSTLKACLKENEGYRHTWRNQMEGVSDTDFVLELLEREGSHRMSITCPDIIASTPTGQSSSLIFEFPRLFYPSIEDVSMLRTLDAKLNLAKKMPIKLHLLCDHRDGCHKVENQRGRTITLNWKAGDYNVHIPKLAMKLLWFGMGGVAKMQSVPAFLPQVDKWIESLFDAPEMPDIDAETLHQMMSRGKPNVPISEEQILKALEQYMKIDPHTQGLKEILNMQDGASFRKDFQLRKVIYTESPNKGRIGWVCDRHFWPGLAQKILQSAPY